MQHQQNQNHQQHLDLLDFFPFEQYPEIREIQKKAIEVIEKTGNSVALELPTGSGKTAIGYAFLKALEASGAKSLFYIAPTKAIVDQVKKLHPETKIVYGRGEHPCLYYTDEDVKADKAPCSMIKDCPHRVDQETGRTLSENVEPCPYLLQKYEAKKGGIVVCTTAFYLFTQLFAKDWEIPSGLVIDEVHRIARTVRDCLSFEISDWHLKRAIELIKRVDEAIAISLESFLQKMVEIISLKSPYKSSLLEDWEIKELITLLMEIDKDSLEQKIKDAITNGIIDPLSERETLKQLEVLVKDLYRYIRSFEFSLSTDKRQPLNYTYAFSKPTIEEKDRVQYKLCIKAYYVAPIVKKLLAPMTLGYSATVGDSEVFGFETGIKFPFYSFPSTFSVGNTKVFMPTDTPNLAMNKKIRQEPTKVLRKVAKAIKKFAEVGKRSLMVVVSEKERHKFMELCHEEGVEAISYGNGISPKEAANIFKSGKGMVLVGTAANYSEGVDFPKQIAPIVFVLRPAYPPPNDPGTLFEEKRFGNMRWAIWNYRVMIEALQVRGRNIRSGEDLGVTIFISQQFRRFLFGSLPEWLKKAYEGKKTLDACIGEAISMLEG